MVSYCIRHILIGLYLLLLLLLLLFPPLFFLFYNLPQLHRGPGPAVICLHDQGTADGSIPGWIDDSGGGGGGGGGTDADY